MWDTERYLEELIALGFKIRWVEYWSMHVGASSTFAQEGAIAKREELEAAERDNVGWALVVAQKAENRSSTTVTSEP